MSENNSKCLNDVCKYKAAIGYWTEQSLMHKDDQASKGILAFKKARKNKYIMPLGIYEVYIIKIFNKKYIIKILLHRNYGYRQPWPQTITKQ